MKTKTHPPMPQVKAVADPLGRFNIKTGTGVVLASSVQDIHASIIVRAVNSHEALLDVAKDLLLSLQDLYESNPVIAGEAFGAALTERVKEAIAQAGEVKS